MSVNEYYSAVSSRNMEEVKRIVALRNIESGKAYKTLDGLLPGLEKIIKLSLKHIGESLSKGDSVESAMLAYADSFISILDQKDLKSYFNADKMGVFSGVVMKALLSSEGIPFISSREVTRSRRDKLLLELERKKCERSVEKILDYCEERFRESVKNSRNEIEMFNLKEASVDEVVSFICNKESEDLVLGSKKRKKPNKNRKKDKKKGVDSSCQKSGKEPPMNRHEGDYEQKKTDIAPFTHLIQEITKINNYSLHPRVGKRWESKEINKLKEIDGYAGLTEEELRLQRAMHFLPGLDKVLAHPVAKVAYFFPTDRGAGAFCRLTYAGESHYGIVYYGYKEQEGNLQIYHRYLSKNSPETLIPERLRELAKDIESRALGEEEDGCSPEDWQVVSGNCQMLIDADGTMTITHTKKQGGHVLTVFPVQPELLTY